MGVTEGQLRQMLNNVSQHKTKSEQKRKKSKYNNERVELHGEKFDSKKEAARYGQLLLLEKAGKISGLKRQIAFVLEVNNQLICKYIADFTYNVGSTEIVEDVKSIMTRKLPVYLLKKKLMKAIHNIEIKET